MSRQKGKGKKRSKSWHRGGVEARQWLRSTQALPTADPMVDYTIAKPLPLKRVGGKNRGETA